MGFSGVTRRTMFNVLSLSCLIYTIGVLIFTVGFLLNRVEISATSGCLATDGQSEATGDQCWIDKRFNKSVIVVIDALRYDFTTPVPDSDLLYHNKLTIFHELSTRYPRRAGLFKFVADPPTTTLQRLKGLTTGSLPTFVDAGSNFAGTEIQEDNLIFQLNSTGHRIVFLGDDTWVNLYNKYFSLSYPFPSFNVKDLHTVDNGINSRLIPDFPGGPDRTLLPELSDSSWDVLIAHYLGVDHCGHRCGPNHPEMASKLSQMNRAVEFIVEGLPEDALLIVIGDHGMTSSGDHGGDSGAELDSAMFVYSPRDFIDEYFVDKLPGAVSQLDFVSTISLLLGLPVPFSNLGSPVYQLLSGPPVPPPSAPWPPHKGPLESLSLTARQIRRYLTLYSVISNDFLPSTLSRLDRLLADCETSLTRVSQSGFQRQQSDDLIAQYQEYLSEVKAMCRDTWAKFDLPYICYGILFAVMASVWTLLVSYVIFLLEYSIVRGRLINSTVQWISVSLAVIFLLIWAIFPLYISPYILFSSYISLIAAVLLVRAMVAILSCYKVSEILRHSLSWKSLVINILAKPSLETYFSFFVLLIYVVSLGGNTFLVQEDKVLPFLYLSLLCVSYLSYINRTQTLLSLKRSEHPREGFRHANPKSPFYLLLTKVWRVTLLVVCMVGCLRFSTNFNLCREEQYPNCETSPFLDKLSNSSLQPLLSTNSRYFISVCSLVSISASLYFLLRFWGNQNGTTFATLCNRFVLALATVFVAFHWAITASANTDWVAPWQLTVFPLATYVCLFVSMLCLVANPVLLYLERVSTGGISVDVSRDVGPQLFSVLDRSIRYRGAPGAQGGRENGAADPTEAPPSKPMIYGMITGYSAPFVALTWIIYILAALLLGQSVSLPLATSLFHVILTLEYTSVTMATPNDPSVPWPTVVSWFILSSHYFFAFGHQATIPSIRFEAAYIGFHGDWNVYIVPFLLILFNTLASTFIFSVGLPLCITWPFYRRYAPSSGNQGEYQLLRDGDFPSRLFQLISAYILVSSTKLISTMATAAILRRHLMVWKIFAPRFVYEAASFLSSLVVLLLIYPFGVWIDYKLRKFMNRCS